MGEAKRKAAGPVKIELMEINGLYCLGFHDKHMRPGRVTTDPKTKIVRFFDTQGQTAVGAEHYSVIFDELMCPEHGPQIPETQVSVAMADMGAWYFFDTADQRDAFWQAIRDRDAGRPYNNTLTAKVL